MSIYATKSTFANQRASINRAVIVGTDRGPRAGTIVEIGDSDEIYIFVPPVGKSSPVEGAMRGYQFAETIGELEANSLPPFTWSWPPRI